MMFSVHFVCYHAATSNLPPLFRSHHYRLCKALSSQHDAITPLADLLYGSGLITDDTRMAVQHTLGLTPYDRTTKLLDAAEKVAQDSMPKAQKFCACLEECGIPVPENILKGKVDVALGFLVAMQIFFFYLQVHVYSDFEKYFLEDAQ